MAAATAQLAPAEAAPASVNEFGTAFRDYTLMETPRQRAVAAFYAEQHAKQTYTFAGEQCDKHLGGAPRREMSIWEAAELLNEVVDDSDPDLDLPQIQHLLQTAEACRKAFPNEDWLHLTGFIHDLGKVLAHPAFGAEPQWAVVGDTFPVGCAFDPAIIHHASFAANPDSRDGRYSTPHGVYAPHCGLSAVRMSWGHDEYMAQVMLRNGCTLPPAAVHIVRFHSFYAWHREGAYGHLCDAADGEALRWVRAFNACDLYSKSIAAEDPAKLRAYYEGLARKYFPCEKLKW